MAVIYVRFQAGSPAHIDAFLREYEAVINEPERTPEAPKRKRTEVPKEEVAERSEAPKEVEAERSEAPKEAERTPAAPKEACVISALPTEPTTLSAAEFQVYKKHVYDHVPYGELSRFGEAYTVDGDQVKLNLWLTQEHYVVTQRGKRCVVFFPKRLEDDDDEIGWEFGTQVMIRLEGAGEQQTYDYEVLHEYDAELQTLRGFVRELVEANFGE